MPASNNAPPYLVVAASGRGLAQSASRARIPVVVLDLFDDMDTRAIAVASRSVSGATLRMHARKLVAAADALCPAGRCAGLVAGSGFESRTRLLEALSVQRRLFGNAPGTIARVKDPVQFFGMLDRLGIPHPEICLEAPSDPQGWLAKRVGAAGGMHVRPMTRRDRAKPGRYFQRREHGRSLSALFVGDGREARILGFNEQWALPGSRNPYRYGGAASVAMLPARAAASAARIVADCTREFGLLGLNGLDFLLDDRDEVRVLEINPRPTATLDLHDGDFPEGLFAVHLQACCGRLPALRREHRSRAHAIVYATEPVRAPAPSHWPAWCTDLPQAGSAIPPGAPICSVHAQAADGAAAKALALRRHDQILQGLGRLAA